MSDFSIRSDSVDVEQIMHQIRARIREKRGVDYTEQQIRELASVKLERFLDPEGIRSDLLAQFHRARATTEPLPSFDFEDTTLYQSHRLPLLQTLRKLLNPILKLFFNPNPLIQALHVQSELNKVYAKGDALYFELIHNLVVELTRLSIEVKNLRMQVESLSSRLDFNERRARALEGVVQYKPSTATGAPRDSGAPQTAAEAPAAAGSASPEGTRPRRRRRRRGRRGGGGSASHRPGPDAIGSVGADSMSPPSFEPSTERPAAEPSERPPQDRDTPPSSDQ